MNKILLLGRKLRRYFPGLPAQFGTVKRYLAIKDVYKIIYDDKYVEHLLFDDVMIQIRQTKRRHEAEANFASILAHLMQAEFEAHIASGPSTTDFTEPKTIEAAREAPDRTFWVEATLKEMHLLQEEMGCWEIIDVDSVPEGQNLIEAKWVFKVKY